MIPYNNFALVAGNKFTSITYGAATGSCSSVTRTTPAASLTFTPVYLRTNLVILTTTTGEKPWDVDRNGNASVGSNWTADVAPDGIGGAAAFRAARRAVRRS